MALAPASSRLPRASGEAVGDGSPRPHTSPALADPSGRGARATPVSRPARLAGIVAAALAGALAGCEPYVEGNGVFEEEDRTPPETLLGVHVEDGIEASVTAGGAQQVTVSGDANLVQHIDTEVVAEPGVGPVLFVRIDVANWSSTIPPRAAIRLGDLRYVFASGHSRVLATGPGGAALEVFASDADVDAGSYPLSAGARVDLSSGARVELHSDGPVTGIVRGGCTLDNLLGAGGCEAVTVPAGESATIQCNPAP